MNKIKAIDTIYGKYKFRSRLEAKWAVYFNAIGLQYIYEKEGFNLGNNVFYLPDFWLPQVNMWAEVKPEEFSEKDLEKVKLLVKGTEYPCVLLIGEPACQPYYYVDYLQDNRRNRGVNPKNLHESKNNHIDPDLRFYKTNCIVSMHHNYPIDEHRFYSWFYEDFFKSSEDDRLIVQSAVDKANHARFEFGEIPA